MPRARNIKPSFFANDELAEIEPIGRLLFIGLWTLADHKGELEWRGKKIKHQILPYDDVSLQEINNIAINLDGSGFIRFYSDKEKIYLKIVNFDKHQNPHKNEREKGSNIPPYSEDMRQVIDLKGLTINRDKSRLIPEDSASNPADSCFLIPDSCSLIPEKESDRSDDQSHTQLIESGFAHFWKTWKQAKKDIGKNDTSPKGETFDKKWKPMFNAAYFKKNSEQDFRNEVNKICDFVKKAHSVEGFNRFENMGTGKLFTQKQWRDE